MNFIEEVDAVSGQPYVALDDKTGQLLTNLDLYAWDYENVRFTSTIVKKLKQLFDVKFEEYRSSVHKMNDISSDTITNNLKLNVQNFFKALWDSIGNVKDWVMDKIWMSQSLAELEQILDESKEYFDTSKPDMYKIEKAKFDDKIMNGKYSQVVSWKAYYETMIQNINATCKELAQIYTESNKWV